MNLHPRFYHKRDEWRQRAKKYTESDEVKLVFMIARPPDEETLESVLKGNRNFRAIT